MASYVANNARREVVTLVLSTAEAEGLLKMAQKSEPLENGQSRAAAERALSALSASTNPSARRAGYFEE